MFEVKDKWVGTMYCEENINTVIDAAVYLMDFMNEDDRILVREIGSGTGGHLLFIEDVAGETIDIYGFLHP